MHGDVHDIGKNIVKVILENYGFPVIDLGRDVPAERVVQAVLRKMTVDAERRKRSAGEQEEGQT